MWKKAITYSLATALTLTTGAFVSVSDTHAATLNPSTVNKAKSEANKVTRVVDNGDVEEKAEQVKESTPATVDSAKERAEDTVDSSRSKAENLRDQAAGASQQVRAAKGKVNQFAPSVSPKVNDAKGKAEQVGEQASKGVFINKSVDSQQAEDKAESTIGKDLNIPNVFAWIFLDIQTGFNKLFN